MTVVEVLEQALRLRHLALMEAKQETRLATVKQRVLKEDIAQLEEALNQAMIENK